MTTLNDSLISIQKVSKLLGVSAQTLRNWDVDAERFPGKPRALPRAGDNEPRRYRESDIRAYMQGKPVHEITSTLARKDLDLIKEGLATTLESLSNLIAILDEIEAAHNNTSTPTSDR